MSSNEYDMSRARDNNSSARDNLIAIDMICRALEIISRVHEISCLPIDMICRALEIISRVHEIICLM